MHEARAAREVIVSAGAVGSPKLLELSGIGNPGVLVRQGIAVVHALPGVGENLRDHYGPTHEVDLQAARHFPCRTGPRHRAACRDRTLRAVPQGIHLSGRCHLAGVRPIHRAGRTGGLRVARQSLLPRNRKPQTADGEGARLLHLRPGAAARELRQHPHPVADPFAEPAINFSFLATERDRRTAVAAVRRAREIAGGIADRGRYRRGDRTRPSSAKR